MLLTPPGHGVPARTGSHTTLDRLRAGLPVTDHPLDLAVARVEQALDRLDEVLRRRAAGEQR